jgi:hypothetical protein
MTTQTGLEPIPHPPGHMLVGNLLGLCGFGYRFSSFYREEPHPFVASMVRALEEALQQASRCPASTMAMRSG